MNKEASNLLAKLVTEIYKNGQLQQKVNQLEEDYKNEVEENLKLSELWRKSQEEKRQLEANRDEVIRSTKEQMKYLEDVKDFYSNEQDFKDMCFPIINSNWSYCDDMLKTLERGKE